MQIENRQKVCALSKVQRLSPQHSCPGFEYYLIQML